MKRKRVDYWSDGDSGWFTDGTEFRLAGVRAPETYQFGGSKATRTVAGMTGRTRGYVNVNEVARDRYGRTVVNMWNRDGSINERMRGKGYRKKGRYNGNDKRTFWDRPTCWGNNLQWVQA